ncbi:MAG: leucine-rich repeat domain-containing protein [Candidatus Poribacteria bacterium]|nr:leucine-rich repeat domain-containing protein [Candidatus Poribacteria bacterium]
MKTKLYAVITLLAFVTLFALPNSFAQEVSPEYVVRVIYFLPSDRQLQPDINAKLDTLMKDSQQFYADQMESHGFNRKTFRLETDASGEVVIHHVKGKFNNMYYNQSPGSAWEEIGNGFDRSKNIYIMFLDTSIAGHKNWNPHGGRIGSMGGFAVVPASGLFFNVGVAIHELGHAFGLSHDYNEDAKITLSLYTVDPMARSFCAAEWLDVHPYFNDNQAPFNQNTTVQMLPPLASSPNAIRLRFEVTDSDGLHQAQLHDDFGVIACQSINGQSNTVEFVTTKLIAGSVTDTSLRIVDKYGNYIQRSFPIDVTSALPPPEVVSIPDRKLAAAIRGTLGLAEENAITQLDMLRLTQLDIAAFWNIQPPIKDITGLEHAKNLEFLFLDYNQIRDIAPLTGLKNLTRLGLLSNQIQDLTPLASANLPRLLTLGLSSNQIQDLTPLASANLPRLKDLKLTNNQIQDITPIIGMTSLTLLYLANNQIQDITPIAEMVHLITLNIADNHIRDITPLTALVKLRALDTEGNPIQDTSPLQQLFPRWPAGQFAISEIMFTSKRGSTNLPQWLELYNNSNTETVIPNQWKIMIESKYPTYQGQLFFSFSGDDSFVVGPKQTLLIVTANARNSGHFPQHRTRILDVSPTILSSEGFAVTILTADGQVVDKVGNLDGNTKTSDSPSWSLLDSRTEDGDRISIIRRYKNGVPLDGTKSTSWILADTKLPSTTTYYGHPTDLSNPGQRVGGPLPVTLSHFRAERVKAGVVLKWTTKSELDNAGFNILRSKTKNGEFKVVNPQLIQGAGTTSEQHDYTWKDTTAKPNIAYYYQIEDISHAGVRKKLATVRMKGLVSASGKLTTRWGDLKLQE